MNVSQQASALDPRSGDVARLVAHRGESLAEMAVNLGLAVTAADGARRAIPIGAMPVVLDDGEIRRRADLAAALASATAKAARWRMREHGAATLSALGATERRLVAATWNGPQRLAVARVDFLGEPEPQALEVNATIPAMQGYSDIAAESWLRTVAATRTELESLIRANGSNTDALRDALETLYREARGSSPQRIGLLCRRGDAQLTELEYLRSRFRAQGLDTVIVHPDELTWRRQFLWHQGRALPLLYRHLFLSRMDREPAPAVEQALLNAHQHGSLVLNPPSPHLEMKSTLALLSSAARMPAVADAMALDATERAAVSASVPWTRRLGADPGSGSPLQEIIAHPDEFVLKRSWSYGGNDVFVGRSRHSPEFAERMQSTYPDARNWEDLCRSAARDERAGGFVVQRAIARVETPQWLCTPASVREARVVTDYSAFASLGAAPAWSGVCRAAASDVVNIVSGGAVVPIIRRRVMEAIVTGQPLSSD